MRKKATTTTSKLPKGRPVNCDPETGLTPRETEVLRELSKGKSYRMIAADFFISIETVRTHAHKIYRKLDVNGREQAVKKIFIRK